MKLSIPFLKDKKKDIEYYLALLLTDEKSTAVILEESQGILKIVGQHSEFFSEHLETISQDTLISLIDKIISRAEEILPPNIETHKTIFGVKESWVEPESKKIKKEHLTRLKQVCSALDMTPIGFMVISEAIANLIQLEDGAPLSAVLVELNQKTVHVSLFRAGKISESANGLIEHSSPAAVDSLLKHFNAAVLPTKIILFHAKESKSLAQHFTNHEWSQSLPFLHVPQIIALPIDFDVKAVTYGAGQQMGFDVPEIAGGINQNQFKDIEEDNSISDKEKVEESIPENIVNDSGFGFMLNEDIAKHAAENSIPNESKITPSTMPIHNDPLPINLGENIKYDESINDEIVTKTQPDKKDSLFASIKSFTPSAFFKKFPNIPTLFSKNNSIKLPIIIIGVILLAVILLSLFLIYGIKAEVVLSVKPRDVKQEVSVTFSTTAANDFSKSIIAAKKVSVSIDGTTSTQATGKKDAGSKAKGSITVFNSSDSPTALSNGTTIKSSNGLLFTLDKDIEIASASGDIFTGTKPGTSQVAVSAKDNGTESNLPSGTKFSINGNNNLAGKNDSAFSGGIKKTITVVSKADLDKLKSDLQKNLEQKAIEELAKKSDSTETVLPGFISKNIESPKFDKAINDEAKEVKLSATVNYDGMSYQTEDLENYDKAILKDHYSQDISFAEKSLKNEVKNPKNINDSETKAQIDITAGLLPKIDNTEVINKIKNQSASTAKKTLSQIPQVTKSEIKYTPNIFLLANLFPRLPKKISITIKSDE